MRRRVAYAPFAIAAAGAAGAGSSAWLRARERRDGGAPVDARLLGTVIATGCRDLALAIPLNSKQRERARALLPAGFVLAKRATLLVETSAADAATLDGRPIGPFRLSEAALAIEPPRAIASLHIPELYVENIYMLSQLGTDPALSAFKAEAGYRSEVTEVSLELGNPARPRVAARAAAAGEIAPAAVCCVLTPGLLPAWLRVPNPGVVYKLWTCDGEGRIVVTTNTNFAISRLAIGWGKVRVPPGTLLHGLLGGGSARGVAFSGAAQRFVNDTYVFED